MNDIGMKVVWVLFAITLTAVGCGGDSNCKAACDVISSCGLKSSGLSCDSDCGDQGDCAACLNDSTCSDIASGQCDADCPGTSFTKK
jgi:hypothetical protein